MFNIAERLDQNSPLAVRDMPSPASQDRS